ncbi:MAG TPA: DNRLRE domain-containing protein [Anaerolineales bacterium]|nr:DNRLRE domain-containing protein [Anaerolineales bacterium]
MMTARIKRPKRMPGQKVMIALRNVFILFLIAVVSSLTACAPPPPAINSLGSTATPLTFTADADAQVNESNPTTNYGNSTYLQVDDVSDPGVESFIHFTVTGLSGTIQTARFRIYDTTNASTNGPALYATGASWTEAALTWKTRPSRLSAALDNKGSISTNTWVEYDVTSWVQANGAFSFVLAADSSDAATFSSRQGSQPPQLVITLADAGTIVPSLTASETSTASTTPTGIATTTSTPSPASTGTPIPGSSLTFITEADAYVKQSNSSTNYGNASTLQVDGASDPDIESFLRFTVTGISGTVQSAQLRLYDTTNGSRNGPAVYATDTSWTETGITWNKRPARTGSVLDNKGSISSATWVEYNVTSLVKGNGTFSFVLAADSSDAVVFSSRQGSQPPQLVITLSGGVTATPAFTPTPTPTLAAGDVVFVGAGDISSCGNDNDELTAQLLDAIPGTVFTTGDDAYDNGTSTEFANCYDPTWGRHKDRTKPIPGNHEYHTSGAAGYFQYFNNIPEYYAYTLGSWRIYALNSEIDVSANSAEVAWLQADLAANPSQCVLAYWHRPRWSSGSTHGSNPDQQTLWQILAQAGAELVLNGHEHNYERFAPMNATGQTDPQGMREIVVGTGGRNHYPFGAILPTSEVQDSSSFGVLKLTLHANGYDWQFIPVAGSTFTDSGSANCH